MLETISWKTYLTIILLAVAVYYIFVGAVFYRSDIIKFLKRKNSSDPYNGELDQSSFDQLEDVVSDIKNSILEKAGETASKSELLMQISARLANYDGLHQPAFRNAITNYIIKHAESICGVSFSEDELEAAWDKLPR